MDKETKIVIGIQGGPGSFNEEAAHWYAKGHRMPLYRVEYCYTTEGVLKAITSGDATHGIFAIQNSIGGMVDESIFAMAKYLFDIKDKFEIIVNHCLLVVPGTKLGAVNTIMSHPQALAQCKTTLFLQYPEMKLTSGKGDLIDQATAAKALSQGEIPDTTAVLASAAAAELYGLDILDRGLQDRVDNYTTFLLVSKAK